MIESAGACRIHHHLVQLSLRIWSIYHDGLVFEVFRVAATTLGLLNLVPAIGCCCLIRGWLLLLLRSLSWTFFATLASLEAR